MAKPDRTRQKGSQNILRSDVDIVVASVYCYCLRAEQSDHQHPQPMLQRSVVSWTSIVINISVNAIGKLGSANLSQRKHDWYERVNGNWHDLILEVQPTKDNKVRLYTIDANLLFHEKNKVRDRFSCLWIWNSCREKTKEPLLVKIWTKVVKLGGETFYVD